MSVANSEPFKDAFFITPAVLQYKLNWLKSVKSSAQNLHIMQLRFMELLRLFSIKISYSVYYPFLYRARPVDEVEIPKLIHRKSYDVNQVGRCNDLKESYFYCSNFWATSIYEIRPNEKDVVSVLILDLTNTAEMPESYLPIVPTCNDILEEDMMSPFVGSGNSIVQGKLNLIHNLMNQIMMLDCDDETSKYYKSIALTKALQQSFDKHSSIVYPSRTTKNCGVNIAIPGKWIDNLHSPNYLGLKFYVEKKRNEFDMDVVLYEIAETSLEDKLQYRNISPIKFPINRELFDYTKKMHQDIKAKLKEGSFYKRHFFPPFHNGTNFLI